MGMSPVGLQTPPTASRSLTTRLGLCVLLAWCLNTSAFGSSPPEYVRQWSYVDQFGIGPYQVRPDGRGNIYVTTNASNPGTVHKYNRFGTLLSSWNVNDGNFTLERLAADGIGNIYVGGTQPLDGQRVIHKFLANGALAGSWALHNDPGYSSRLLTGLDADSSGFVYAAYSQGVYKPELFRWEYTTMIQVYDSNGTFLYSWDAGSTPSLGGRIAVDRQGTTLAFIYYASFIHVKLFATGGSVIADIDMSSAGDGPNTNLREPAITDDQHVFVLGVANRVYEFSPTGEFLNKWGSGGSGNGQFNSPYTIGRDSNHDLLVGDTDNHRVQVFRRPCDGAVVVPQGPTGYAETPIFEPDGTTLFGIFPQSPMALHAELTGSCECCEYRQDIYAVFSANGRAVPKATLYGEDTNNGTDTGYGHRDNPVQNTPGDQYLPTRPYGCTYQGSDSPYFIIKQVGPTRVTYEAEYNYRFEVVHVDGRGCAPAIEETADERFKCFKVSGQVSGNPVLTSCSGAAAYLTTTSAEEDSASITVNGTNVVLHFRLDPDSLVVGTSTDDFFTDTDGVHYHDVDLAVEGLVGTRWIAYGAGREWNDGFLFQRPASQHITLTVAVDGVSAELDHTLSATVGVATARPTGSGLRFRRNPCVQSAEMLFSTAHPGRVRVVVADLAGRVVRVVYDRHDAQEGLHVLTWDLRDSQGRRVPSGAYFVRVLGDGRSERGTLIVM